ncbi:MAG: Druantia anti-phage system protein DruA, partial [Elusimicrobiota bacterium]
LIASHPDWHRNRLSQELAQAWNWRTDTGRLKDMAARTMMLKLSRRGLIVLPSPRRQQAPRKPPSPELPGLENLPPPIIANLHELAPVIIEPLHAKHPDYRAFSRHLARHHYLGHRGPVGEHLAYLARDRHGRDVACLLFGASAWKAAPRDQFIGWDDATRAKRLNWTTNNTRFLILPWVRVPHLASHLLARVLRRLSADWQAKYGHPIRLVETFVDRSRFKGTCYRAANWTLVGQTQGRSRQDRDRALQVPVKDIYLYPLSPRFREELCRVDG